MTLRYPRQRPAGAPGRSRRQVRRTRGFFATPQDPDDLSYAILADEVFERSPRPVITETGVLDVRGEMICRVSIPIKQPLGFGRKAEVQDSFNAIMPADELFKVPGALRYADGSEFDDEGDQDGEEDE